MGNHDLALASVSEEIPGKARIGVRSASLVGLPASTQDPGAPVP